jgi:hypothetical protein
MYRDTSGRAPVPWAEVAIADNPLHASIGSYLASRGGSVEDATGGGLTEEMAREIGVDGHAALRLALRQMEDEGVITRDMRGLRVYRITLTAGPVAGRALNQSGPDSVGPTVVPPVAPATDPLDEPAGWPSSWEPPAAAVSPSAAWRNAPPPQSPPVAPPAWQFPPPTGYPLPYPPPFPPAPGPPTNKWAVAALILGILGIWPLIGVASIFAAAFGLLAYVEVEHSEGAQGGKGIAIAGIVLGAIGLVILALVLVANRDL